jgi:hypothetical protein
MAGVQLEIVGLALCGNLAADVGDFECGAVEARGGDERSGAFPAVEQPGLRQRPERAVHRHARTAIVGHQFVFIGNAVARLPSARHDPRLDLAPNTLVERDGFHASRAFMPRT